MITPMKKVTVLTVAGAVEETLQALRTLEILHLTPLQAAAGAKLNKARGEMNRVQKALEVVPEKAPKGVTPVKDAAPAASLIDEIQKLVAESKQAEIDKEQAEEELTKLSMFKNLDPATAAALQAKGIFVKLYQLHAGKIPFEVDGEGVVEEFGQDENGKYVAVVSRGEAPVAVKGNFTEISMPQKSLAEYREMEAKAKETLARVEKRLGELSGVRESIEDKLLEVGDDYRMVEAEASMVGDKNVAAVQGFCPAPRVGELEKAAREHGWGLLVDDPAEDDDIPTLLTYSKLSRPMQFLYDIIGISPGYKEVDVSAVFLCFFSIFFAMIVGDSAYGLLFLGLALFARKKMPKANPAGFHFIYLMSIATIVWGVINASFLGLSPALAGWTYYLDITNYGWLPEPLKNAMLSGCLNR